MRPRGITLEMALRALATIASEPTSPGDLAAALGCSRDTVERIIRGAMSANVPVEKRREGRRVLYSLGKPPRWLEAWARRGEDPKP